MAKKLRLKIAWDGPGGSIYTSSRVRPCLGTTNKKLSDKLVYSNSVAEWCVRKLILQVTKVEKLLIRTKQNLVLTSVKYICFLFHHYITLGIFKREVKNIMRI